MEQEERANKIAAGVFLVGLGVLFTGVVHFWPGILLVIGAATLARGVAEGQQWQEVSGGIWLIGLGFLFMVGFSWPWLLILIGVSMLVGRSTMGCNSGEKRKRKNDEMTAREIA